MSIFSNLFRGKITWETAETQIEAWASQTVGANPALTGIVSGVTADLKQAASDAIATADTLAGPLLAAGADAVSTAFTTAATAYLGPFGNVASAAAHDSIAKIRDGLKAALDAEAAALIASLKPPPAVPLAQAPNVQAAQAQIDAKWPPAAPLAGGVSVG